MLHLSLASWQVFLLLSLLCELPLQPLSAPRVPLVPVSSSPSRRPSTPILKVAVSLLDQQSAISQVHEVTFHSLFMLHAQVSQPPFAVKSSLFRVTSLVPFTRAQLHAFPTLVS